MQIKITLQPEIYKKLKESSKENMRTLSAEINFMLQKVYGVSTTPETTTPRREGDLW